MHPFTNLRPKRTVFLITDAEGVGGVPAESDGPERWRDAQLLTGEICAAAEGFAAERMTKIGRKAVARDLFSRV